MLFLETAPAAGVPTIDEAMLWAIIACPLVAWGLIVLYVRKLPADRRIPGDRRHRRGLRPQLRHAL